MGRFLVYRSHVRLSRAVYFAGIGVVVVGFAIRYASLPAMVASHFDASGRPNAWMHRSAFAWFSAVLLTIVCSVTFVAPLLVAKLPPSLVNLPNKNYWLAPERKAETVRRFCARMEWFGVALLGFIAFVYELVFEANAAGRGLANGPFLIALIAFIVVAVIWLVSLYRAFALPK